MRESKRKNKPKAKRSALPTAEERKKVLAQMKAEAVLRCSFCFKNTDQVKKSIAGPRVYICDVCTVGFLRVSSVNVVLPDLEKIRLTCSFCGKHYGQVRVCRSGSTIICPDCLDLCKEILEEEILGYQCDSCNKRFKDPLRKTVSTQICDPCSGDYFDLHKSVDDLIRAHSAYLDLQRQIEEGTELSADVRTWYEALKPLQEAYHRLQQLSAEVQEAQEEEE